MAKTIFAQTYSKFITKMKSLNTILIIALTLAIGVLYFLHFTKDSKSPVKTETEGGTTIPTVVDATIAYINIDSMLVQMEMFKDLQAELSKKQKDLEGTFGAKYKAFEKNVTDLQSKVNKGLLTRAEAEQMNQQLANDQMQLENLNSTYTQQIQEESIIANRKVVDYIMEYLKEYTADKNIKFIFSYAFGGNLLYMDGNYDITNDILKGVNQKYLAEKASVKK